LLLLFWTLIEMNRIFDFLQPENGFSAIFGILWFSVAIFGLFDTIKYYVSIDNIEDTLNTNTNSENE